MRTGEGGGEGRQRHFDSTAMARHGPTCSRLASRQKAGGPEQTTSKKRKCPPSVNVIDEQKIPAEYNALTVTLPLLQ